MPITQLPKVQVKRMDPFRINYRFSGNWNSLHSLRRNEAAKVCWCKIFLSRLFQRLANDVRFQFQDFTFLLAWVALSCRFFPLVALLQCQQNVFGMNIANVLSNTFPLAIRKAKTCVLLRKSFLQSFYFEQEADCILDGFPNDFHLLDHRKRFVYW